MHAWAVYFLWHFPWTRVLQALPGALSEGARTFLRSRFVAGPGDCLTDSHLLEPLIVPDLRPAPVVARWQGRPARLDPDFRNRRSYSVVLTISSILR